MIKVEIITPEGLLHTADCDEVIIPTTSGQIGVRTGHRPLVTVLKKGVVRVKKDGKADESFEVGGGFAEVLPNAVSIISRHSAKAE